ncbi:hypothetical protein OH76DRAFT_1364832 [Lentinus brumalis]|uniref:BTB domain-containing protein n=1 Tax=Lentinus brumalis TaxID=2498619 RepID=A0A371CM24_9APHY|nr:hypothetical protein OH76DRAFT_1364832 [Polyporus brumalis]
MSIARDDQVWLQDGNHVIIVSEDDVAFRVHLATIAHRSDIFRDLFALPRSDTSHDMVEGCPAIRLQDSSTNLRHLLLVLSTTTPMTSSDVSRSPLDSLVRLGHKYAVHDVLSDALGRLKKYLSNSR